jgi:plastocyanin
MFQLGILPPTTPATADGGGAPAPSGAGGPPAGSIPLTAVGFAFDKKTLEAPAGQPFTIYLTNQDGPGTPHDVEIRKADGTPIKDVPPTDGGKAMPYPYDPLEPGDYVFICSIHPIEAMTGTLKVQ